MSRPTQPTGAATPSGRVVKPEGERTTDLPLTPDRYGVWYDVEADRLDQGFSTVDTIADDFKQAFARTQGRFNAIQHRVCRGYFILHERNSTWCGHPLCPSCWVRRQLQARAIFSAARDRAQGFMVKITDGIGIPELANPPSHFDRVFSSRNDPNVRCVAWWKELLPSDDWQFGWMGRKVGLFVTRGGEPQPRRGKRAADGSIGVPVFNPDDSAFATVWQHWFGDVDAALMFFREQMRSTWTRVHHPMVGVCIDSMLGGGIDLGRTFQSTSIPVSWNP